jgi:hypothetical protein
LHLSVPGEIKRLRQAVLSRWHAVSLERCEIGWQRLAHDA